MSDTDYFKIEPHSTIDKTFVVNGPDDLRFYVDFDDVNHKRVDKLAELAVSALNAYWSNTSARTVIEREVDHAEQVCGSCGAVFPRDSIYFDADSEHSVYATGKCPTCGGWF